MILDFKQPQQLIIHLIRVQGNKGRIIRNIQQPNNAPRNEYNELGESIEAKPLEQVEAGEQGQVEEYEVYYVHKRLRAKEQETNSYNDEYTRFTIASQTQLGKDLHRLNVLKGDKFIDCVGVEYAIEQVDHVAQMRNKEMLLEIVARRS